MPGEVCLGRDAPRGVVVGPSPERPPLKRRVHRDRLAGPLAQSCHRRVVDLHLRELRHDRCVECFGHPRHRRPVRAARLMPGAPVLNTLPVGVGLGAHRASAGTPQDLGQQMRPPRVSLAAGDTFPKSAARVSWRSTPSLSRRVAWIRGAHDRLLSHCAA